MKEINITLPDGSVKSMAAGSNSFDVAMSISEGLARNVDYYEYTFERFVRSRVFDDLLSANKTLSGTSRFARRS